MRARTETQNANFYTKFHEDWSTCSKGETGGQSTSTKVKMGNQADTQTALRCQSKLFP
jgi:hypothetical protein